LAGAIPALPSRALCALWLPVGAVAQPGVAVAALLLASLGVAFGLALARRARSQAVARVRRLGARGERAALRLLRRRGYRVLGTQVSGAVLVVVDGAERRFPVRADALLRRRERRFVAEIKAGAVAARLGNRGTRRQLMEYAHAFDVDGVLLVDAARGEILEVEFPPRG